MPENTKNTEVRKVGSAISICSILRENPHATAKLRGSRSYPEISGRVKFYQMRSGVLVAAEVFGLPEPRTVNLSMTRAMQFTASQNGRSPIMVGKRPSTPEDLRPPLSETMQPLMPENLQTVACSAPVFGFHIHGGSSCSGNRTDPFAAAGEHYNPRGCEHPFHAGDMPPLFGNNGYAFQIFLTDRFSVNEIIGKTVIIHSGPDDFASQPGGNSGERIACGQIVGRESRR